MEVRVIYCLKNGSSSSSCVECFYTSTNTKLDLFLFIIQKRQDTRTRHSSPPFNQIVIDDCKTKRKTVLFTIDYTMNALSISFPVDWLEWIVAFSCHFFLLSLELACHQTSNLNLEICSREYRMYKITFLMEWLIGFKGSFQGRSFSSMYCMMRMGMDTFSSTRRAMSEVVHNTCRQNTLCSSFTQVRDSHRGSEWVRFRSVGESTVE